MLIADNRVIVEGVNLVKKHTKPNPQLGVAGGIVEKEASIHVSNVAIVNPATGKADRVGSVSKMRRKYVSSSLTANLFNYIGEYDGETA